MYFSYRIILSLLWTLVSYYSKEIFKLDYSGLFIELGILVSIISVSCFCDILSGDGLCFLYDLGVAIWITDDMIGGAGKLKV